MNQRRLPSILAGLAAVALTAIVATIYRDVARTYYFNDDFQWLQGARTFAVARVLHIERYNHFYRPVIEVYFFLGRRLFGCDALSFHAASVVVHLLNTALLYGFSRALTKNRVFAGVAALLFAVQPGYVQAVVWVAAITDMLPATWYLLALWMYLLFLERGRWLYYVISLAAFLTCLLTHESSATLLAMMIAVEWLTVVDAREAAPASLATRGTRYMPFALLLASYLALEYVVNSRSYLITEGHYQIGWHAVTHGLDYLVTLLMGVHNVFFRSLAIVAAAALLVLGTPRTRFFVAWMLVTIVPSTFFVWENSSRYLYLPAAGFAMLLAEGILALYRVLTPRLSLRAARITAGVLTLALAAQFAISASKRPREFRELTRPYRRFVAAVRRANPAPVANSIVYVDRENADGVPELYQDPAAEVATCGTDVHVVLR